MTGSTCRVCGHENELGANYCSSCGEPLDHRGGENTTLTFIPEGLIADEEEAGLEEPELPPGTGMLLVRRGPSAGSRYLLDSPVTTLGRHPDSTVFLDDVTVSRRHAEIRRTESGYEVVDVGSLNGTYLNRERVERSGLVDGDMIQVGKFKLMFVASEGGRPPE